MRIHHDRSIREKLTLIVLTASGVSILVACSLLAIYDLAALRRQIAVNLVSTAGIVGSNTTAALSFGDARSATETLGSLAAQPHIMAACVYGRDEKVFAQYLRAGSDSHVMPSSPASDRILFSPRDVTVFRQIVLNGEQIGSICLKSDLGELYMRVRHFVEILVAALLAALVTAYVLASRLQRVISEPVLELSRTASAVSLSKDYSVRATKTSNDEIGSLVGRFNEMLSQIQERDTALRSAHDQLEARVDERTRELLTQVAERKQAEQALVERTTFLNSLIENTPIGIVAINSDHAVDMCNPAFEKLFRYRQQDILGRPLYNLLNAADGVQDELISNRDRLWAGKTTHVVTRRGRSDGTLVDVEAFSVPLVVAGKVSGAVLLYQDITERKQAEAALLRAKEAAEAASRAKSEFLANMSHEIRTPMNGIMGMTDLALDTSLTPEQREYLEMVKNSAQSLLTIINDILDFSKIEAGKLDIEMIDFPFHQSLGETLRTLALRAHQKGLELAWRVGAGVPEFLKGDVGRLRQVLVNLTGNAVKFTDHGEIVVSVEKESEDDQGITLHFQIRDTGIGIAPEKQKMVFEAFTQADASASRQYGGTGLGLAITSRLVALMGGRIWLKSEIGRGSTFHFTSHFAFAESVPSPTPPLDVQVLQDLPVLVVDDNETSRLILKETLSRWGMAPECVDAGPAALSALDDAYRAGNPFRLVITDMQMPGMDGCALSTEIRDRSGFGEVPIMVLSSSGQSNETSQCRRLDISQYLMKPVQPSELLDAILKTLSKPLAEGSVSRKKPALPGKAGTRLKILLAEDNAVNRKLATTLLAKHGHTVIATENGQQALHALEKESIDLVLMDVQMPVMDGFETIVAIRANEQRSGAHLPVIALTAHAMKGDREKCIEVGADDYVAKPIRTTELLAAIDRAKSKRVVAPRLAAAAPSPLEPAIDVDAALERIEGDRELLDEIFRLFIGECPRNMAGIRKAFAERDARLLERLAHGIKGASANIGAGPVSDAAAALEKQAHAGNLEAAGALIDTLQLEADRLLAELDFLCRKVAP
jgi:two-component system, sensor histidine kinase and response regulator